MDVGRRKNRTNKRDHGLSFETAVLIFDDRLAASRTDPHPDGDRWQTVGMIGEVALFVVHTWPERTLKRAKKLAGSSAPAKRRRMKGKPMKKGTSKTLTPEQAAELKALAALTENEINTRDIPEQSDWSNAKRGVFYRPVKQQLTLRLDADVVAWFKAHSPQGKGYQTTINNALREYVSEKEAG